MSDRFVHIALLEQRVAEVVVGFRVVGIDLQRLLVMDDRFVHIALLEQRVAEVVVGFRVVGFDLQRLLVMSDRFVHAALLEQRVAEVVVGFRVVGFDLQRLLVMGDRFVHIALLEQRVAEVVVGNEVVRRAGERVSPQRFTVPPISSLRARAENQSHQNDRGAAAQHHAAVTPAGAQIRRRPGQQQIQADLRQIGVAIRMGVVGYLHNPDHRDHHPQIPEPADHEARDASGERPMPLRIWPAATPVPRPPARAADSSWGWDKDTPVPTDRSSAKGR